MTKQGDELIHAGELIHKTCTRLATELAELEKRFPSNCIEGKDDPTPDLNLWHGESPFFPIDDDVTCNCGCGQSIIVNELYNRLVNARLIAGIPFYISSWNRCEALNLKEEGSSTSSHLVGEAVDIYIASSAYRFIILKALLAAGFTRIGIYPWGLHVDVSQVKLQDLMWLSQ